MDGLYAFFGSAGFLPHGDCIQRRPDILTLHLASDLVIAAACFSIPAAILAFVRRRRDLAPEDQRVALLMGLFILGCGLTQVTGAVALWTPLYGLDGLIKALTALASILTAIALWPMLPRLLKIPSPSALSRLQATLDEVQANRASLQAEVGARARESEALAGRLAAVMEAVPDAMVVTDRTGVIQAFSTAAERLFGYGRDEVLGRDVAMLVPQPNAEHDERFASYVATGGHKITDRMVMGRRKDGTQFPAELSVGEEKTGTEGQFTGFVRDLTERQTSEQRIHELQSQLLHVSRLNEMGQMASAFAHELNQPLSAASSFVSGAKRLIEKGELPLAAVGCQKAIEQISRAGDVIRRLRDFVGRGHAERRLESLPQLVEESAALALVGTRGDGVTAQMRFSPEAGVAVVDRVQVQQVLVNLIRNAVEAMASALERQLTISTARLGGDLVEVAIADTGPGLSPIVRDRLFQPFATTKAAGMGVGLSLCRIIVEAHGGSIWAEDRPEGGAIFRFTLPVV